MFFVTVIAALRSASFSPTVSMAVSSLAFRCWFCVPVRLLLFAVMSSAASPGFLVTTLTRLCAIVSNNRLSSHEPETVNRHFPFHVVPIVFYVEGSVGVFRNNLTTFPLAAFLKITFQHCANFPRACVTTRALRGASGFKRRPRT